MKTNIIVMILALLICVSCHPKKATFYSYEKGEVGIKGQVSYDAAPMADAEVYLYRSKKKNFRGPADFMDATDASGNYFIDVPSGKYYIVARKRKEKRKRSQRRGPLRKGDYYSDNIYEPVVVIEDHTTKVNLKLKKLFGQMIQSRSGQERTGTSLSGLIVDESGAPMPGVYAFAYKNDELNREPDFFSTATEADGRFTMYFPASGRYYVGAKASVRGKPTTGELYSLYEGARGSAVFVKYGESVEGIKIILRKYQ